MFCKDNEIADARHTSTKVFLFELRHHRYDFMTSPKDIDILQRLTLGSTANFCREKKYTERLICLCASLPPGAFTDQAQAPLPQSSCSHFQSHYRNLNKAFLWSCPQPTIKRSDRLMSTSNAQRRHDSPPPPKTSPDPLNLAQAAM